MLEHWILGLKYLLDHRNAPIHQLTKFHVSRNIFSLSRNILYFFSNFFINQIYIGVQKKLPLKQILIDLKISENSQFIFREIMWWQAWQSFQQEGRRDYVYLSAFSKLTYPRFWNGNLKHFYGAQQRTTICFFHNLESSNRQNYGIPNKRISILKSGIIVENHDRLVNWHDMSWQTTSQHRKTMKHIFCGI